jgi:hypothetical protein
MALVKQKSKGHLVKAIRLKYMSKHQKHMVVDYSMDSVQHRQSRYEVNVNYESCEMFFVETTKLID